MKKFSWLIFLLLFSLQTTPSYTLELKLKIPKDLKSSPTKPKSNSNPVPKPKQKNNRPKKSGSRNQTKQKVEKEPIANIDGTRQQPQKLNVGDRSNLIKEEPILVQLSTPEIKNVDFDPFQADEEIEIPPCL